MEECANLESVKVVTTIKRRKIGSILAILLFGSCIIGESDREIRFETTPIERRKTMHDEKKITTEMPVKTELSEILTMDVETDWHTYPETDEENTWDPEEQGGITVVPENPITEKPVPEPLDPEHSELPEEHEGMGNLPGHEENVPVEEGKTEEEIIENETIEGEIAEGETMKDETAENETTEGGTTEGETTGGETTEGGTTEGETTGDETTEGETTGGETTEGGMTESETPGEEMPEGEGTEEGENVDSGGSADLTSPWIVDETGMLCGVRSEVLEMEEGVLILPEEGITGIRKGAFSGISNGVYEMVIPVSIQEIETGALAELTELEWIEAEDHPEFVCQDGVLFCAEMTEIVAFPAGKTGAYIAPSSVERIAACAFENSRLERLDLWECKTVVMDVGIFGTGNGDGITIAVPNGSLDHYQEIFAGSMVKLV